MESTFSRSPGRPSSDGSGEAFCYVPGRSGREGFHLQLQTIMDHIGQWAHVVDENLMIVYSNRGFEELAKELVGYQNVLGEYLFNVFPRPPKRARLEYRSVFANRTTMITEDTYYVHGREIVVETRKVPLFHEGYVEHILTIMSDMTERRRTERALIESEEKHRSLVEISGDPIMLVEQGGEIAFVNDAMARALGEDKSSLLGHSFLEMLSEETATDLRAAIVGGLKDTALHRSELELTLDGKQHWYDVLVKPWKGSGRANPMFLVVAREFTEMRDEREDLVAAQAELERKVEMRTQELRSLNEQLRFAIAERRRSDIALGESEGLYRTLAHNFPNTAVAVFGKDRRIKIAYGQLLPRLGLSRDLVGGKRARDLFPTEVGSGLETSIREALLGRPSIIEMELGEIALEATSVPVNDRKGSIVAAMIVLQDVTLRRKQEGELLRFQKMEAIGKLAGGIAHDFNNILTSILGNSSLALMELGPNDTKARERIELMEVAVMRAKGLTSQLLTFSKGGEPVRKRIDLDRLLRETADLVLSGSNTICEFEQDQELWWVEADEGQLSQVFSNLLVNAKEAMPEGGEVMVSLSNFRAEGPTKSFLPAGDYVRIIIKDTGPGVLAGHREKIFEPYFTTKRGGSGLGLSIAYSVVRKHGGYIDLDTHSEGGARFSVYLPAVSEASRPSSEEEKELISGKGRVLIMDDETSILEVATEMMRHLGYEVSAAEDGVGAIAMYRDAMREGRGFDLVIMDLTIPGGMGGKEAVSHILDINPEARVIVSSGYSYDPIMADYKAYGFSGVMPKPYSLLELSHILSEMLGH